jgi:hypothetical protein
MHAPAFAAWMMLVSACAGRHQTIEYTPLGEHEYRTRKQPAVLSERSPEQLAAEGYVPIGSIAVLRVASICYETCKVIEHRQGTTAALLAEAGQRGGDLVVLEKDNVETTRDVAKQGPCLESYIEDRPIETFVPPVGGAGNRYVPVPRSVEVCTEFAMLHGHETFQQSAGVVWRRE